MALKQNTLGRSPSSRLRQINESIGKDTLLSYLIIKKIYNKISEEDRIDLTKDTINLFNMSSGDFRELANAIDVVCSINQYENITLTEPEDEELPLLDSETYSELSKKIVSQKFFLKTECSEVFKEFLNDSGSFEIKEKNDKISLTKMDNRVLQRTEGCCLEEALSKMVSKIDDYKIIFDPLEIIYESAVDPIWIKKFKTRMSDLNIRFKYETYCIGKNHHYAFLRTILGAVIGPMCSSEDFAIERAMVVFYEKFFGNKSNLDFYDDDPKGEKSFKFRKS